MNFQDELKQTFGHYGFTLTDRQAEQFETFYRLLLLWNEKFNLTTITEPSSVIVKHFLDSVLLVPHIKPNATMVDIGSGAGFPGIPIKIMRDDVQITLVDALQKRTLFLKEVVQSLELDNVLVLHERAEDLARLPHHRGEYQYAVSRAVANLSTLLEYCVPLVQVGGTVVAYKAKEVSAEIEAANHAMEMLHVELNHIEHFTITETESERNLVFFTKKSNTPDVFPRDKNQPKLKPL